VAALAALLAALTRVDEHSEYADRFHFVARRSFEEFQYKKEEFPKHGSTLIDRKKVAMSPNQIGSGCFRGVATIVATLLSPSKIPLAKNRIAPFGDVARILATFVATPLETRLLNRKRVKTIHPNG
jgi:hypothetical protein